MDTQKVEKKLQMYINPQQSIIIHIRRIVSIYEAIEKLPLQTLNQPMCALPRESAGFKFDFSLDFKTGCEIHNLHFDLLFACLAFFILFRILV